jgi:hypothetical protein
MSWRRATRGKELRLVAAVRCSQKKRTLSRGNGKWLKDAEDLSTECRCSLYNYDARVPTEREGLQTTHHGRKPSVYEKLEKRDVMVKTNPAIYCRTLLKKVKLGCDNNDINSS